MNDNTPIQINGVEYTPITSRLDSSEVSKMINNSPVQGITIKPPEVDLSSKAELKERIDDTYVQLRQLNDKTSFQTMYIKQLKADLDEERKKRVVAENKLSTKDWKLAALSLFVGIIAGFIGGLLLSFAIS